MIICSDRRRRVLASAGVLAVIITTGWPAPRALAAGELAISLDRVHWGEVVDAPLFDPSHRWVPGDVGVRSVWVRNGSGSTADLLVRATAPGAATLRGPLSVGVSTPDGREPVEVPLTGATVRLSEVTAGGVRELQVRVALPASTTNAGQGDQVSLRLRLSLTQRVVGHDHRSPLAGTGATELLAGSTALGLVLGSTGMIMLATARARRPR